MGMPMPKTNKQTKYEKPKQSVSPFNKFLIGLIGKDVEIDHKTKNLIKGKLILFDPQHLNLIIEQEIKQEDYYSLIRGTEYNSINIKKSEVD